MGHMLVYVTHAVCPVPVGSIMYTCSPFVILHFRKVITSTPFAAVMCPSLLLSLRWGEHHSRNILPWCGSGPVPSPMMQQALPACCWGWSPVKAAQAPQQPGTATRHAEWPFHGKVTPPARLQATKNPQKASKQSWDGRPREGGEPTDLLMPGLGSSFPPAGGMRGEQCPLAIPLKYFQGS